MPQQDESFDPYRYGHPDTPPPPEFAPPGYTPPAVDLGKPPPPPAYPSSDPYRYGPPTDAPYPPYHPNPVSRGGGTSGKAVAGLVLGILSVVFFWTSIIDIVLIVLAVIFGCLGLREAKANRVGGRGQAIAGLICAGVATVLVAVSIVLFVRAADRCGGFGNQDDPGFNTCVEKHLF